MTRRTLALVLLLTVPLLAQGHKDRPPSVSIMASGSPFTSARTVPITATASDDRGIRQVEFFDGGASKGVDTSAPYSVDWPITSAQNGVHNWWATATDTAGHRTDAATIYLTVNIATATPPTDSTWTFCANEGASCTFTGSRAVRYGASGVYATQTFTDGTLCSNAVFGDPIYGVVKHCDLGSVAPSPTPTPTPIPTASGYGPQSTLTCPTPSVIVLAGGNIQAAVDANPMGTTICIGAGTTFLRASIRPKSGDTFVGTYGAILDGTGWTSSDPTQAAFRAHNEDIDSVTIRNLVIRNMPQKCVHAFRDYSSGWIVQHNVITGCKTGLSLSSDAVVTDNIITHNVGDPTNPDAGLRGGGYVFNEGSTIRVEHNEISYNGPEQKSINIRAITWRNNFVHHNLGGGIWCDGDCDGSLVEGNTVEDNVVNVWWEGARNSIIRNNVIRRAAEQGVFLSTSKHIEVVGNTLEDNQFGIHAFVDLDIIGFYAWSDDLADNWIHGNTIRIPAGGYGGLFSHIGSATSPTAYVTNTKNNRFDANTYTVVAGTSAAAWLWEIPKGWADWRALPQDATGTVK